MIWPQLYNWSLTETCLQCGSSEYNLMLLPSMLENNIAHRVCVCIYLHEMNMSYVRFGVSFYVKLYYPTLFFVFSFRKENLKSPLIFLLFSPFPFLGSRSTFQSRVPNWSNDTMKLMRLWKLQSACRHKVLIISVVTNVVIFEYYFLSPFTIQLLEISPLFPQRN